VNEYIITNGAEVKLFLTNMIRLSKLIVILFFIIEVADVQNEILYQAQIYGVDPDTALRIAFCESRYDIYAKNPKSSAYGIYQFTTPTWKYIGGKDRYDWRENVEQFMRWYPKKKSWWVCQ